MKLFSSLGSWVRCSALAAGFLALSLASGCVVEHHDGTVVTQLTDLSVEWSIGGSDVTQLCDAYDIDSFRVTVDGPETHVVDTDCYDDAWALDLQDIEEGRYDISVVARDVDGYELAALETTIDLGNPVTIPMDFEDGDFVGCVIAGAVCQ